MRSHYLGHLAAHPDGWSRDCVGEHLTASTLISSEDGDQVLLTLHRKIGRWLQTGGHIEWTDRSLLAAARREAVEESGIPGLSLEPEPLLLSRHQVRCGPIEPCFHLDVQFLAITQPGTTPVISEESADLRWFAADQVPAEDESVVELVAAASRRLVASDRPARSAVSNCSATRGSATE